ncbi:S41 family peptidase [Motiliproteus coralliicola]|uniref:S41 family peptidase n=1 Tax=Motiliproteus coralliicola TaxID=2283196 RepID=A0A369WAN2_9GAMM|nr:S41 family peptidase [Motiliproteus coralliicola]RDE18351.1 S41 family peptidase [Motiliproteus coralliicola]
MKKTAKQLTAILALGFGLGCGVTVAEEQQSEPKPPLPLEELRTFAEVFERIKGAYVEEVSDAELLENAVKGMLSGLDPHSAYLDPKAFDSLQVNTSGEFGGLGIEVGMEDGAIRVVAPIDDTPAQRAGVQPGDRIVKLDNKPVRGLDLMQAVNLMRGKPGTKIELTIMRDNQPQPLVLTLTRAVIKVASVKQRMLDDNFGYLRVSQFQVHTGDDLVKGIEKLKQQGQLRGLILDLRNNPGGVLQAAVEVSDAFLEEGLVVYTKGRIQQSDLSYSATPKNPSGELPVVVLINSGSASASEIVAGALQDHGRAVIMGTPSFGKGSVQTVLPLANERALKLTTARYFTPNGRSIQAEGIVPDIEVEQATLTRRDTRQRVKEADLVGHLDNGNDSAAANDSDNGRSDSDTKLLENDYQLNEALNLLKALSIVAVKAS